MRHVYGSKMRPGTTGRSIFNGKSGQVKALYWQSGWMVSVRYADLFTCAGNSTYSYASASGRIPRPRDGHHLWGPQTRLVNLLSFS
jgi:hypothetical protein